MYYLFSLPNGITHSNIGSSSMSDSTLEVYLVVEVVVVVYVKVIVLLVVVVVLVVVIIIVEELV